SDGVVFLDSAGSLGGDSHLRATLNLAWEGDRFAITPTVNYIGSAKFDNRWGAEDIDDNHVGAEWFLNLSGRYSFDDERGVAIYGCVNNVFDTDPPVAPGTFFLPYSTNTAQYPVIGRYFFVGARVRL